MNGTVTDRAKMLAKRLLDENGRGRSWREIARADYSNKVNFATLNRFAIHEGKWMPKDRRILKVLGLIEPKLEEWCGQKTVKKAIRGMVKATKNALKVNDGKN
jgi:hypothetical protein